MAKNMVSLFRQVIDAYMESFETALPGIISKVNDDGTVDVTPSIRNCLANMQLQNGGGALEAILEIPVLFPGTASTLVKFELKKGDPVLLVASSRDLGAWASGKWEEAPFNPLSFDGNDLNDLVAVPVRRLSHGSKPKSVIKINADGSIGVEADGQVSIKADKVAIDASEASLTGSLKVEGDISAGGNVDATGNVSATGDVSAMGLSLGTHVHAVSSVGAPTGSPMAPPPPSV